jgi:hypothetical protein
VTRASIASKPPFEEIGWEIAGQLVCLAGPEQVAEAFSIVVENMAMPSKNLGAAGP